jgi:hypothetical protein
MTRYAPAARPTLWLIGVTTGKSSIMRAFPAWAGILGLNDAAIAGIDLPSHARPAAYREAVAFIKGDPLSKGALVTTHKLDLYEAAQGLFDEVDGLVRLMGETSCLSKRGGRLTAHAKDPITSGLALDGFLPEGHFARTGAKLLVMEQGARRSRSPGTCCGASASAGRAGRRASWSRTPTPRGSQASGASTAPSASTCRSNMPWSSGRARTTRRSRA